MSTFNSDEVQSALEAIDRAGQYLTKSEWIELCEEVADYYATSAEAAREEAQETGG